MTNTRELQKGKILVVEDAKTASLVIVAKELKSQQEKIYALEEVLNKLRGSASATESFPEEV